MSFYLWTWISKSSARGEEHISIGISLQMLFSYTQEVGIGYDGFHTPDKTVSLAKGRLVTTINYVLESGMPSTSNSALKTTTYTDNVGKVVQVASINHTNGKDYVYNNLDFVGKVLRTKAIVQNRYIGQNVTIEQNFSYDKGQRTKSICQRVDNGSPQAFWEPVARYKYDGIGKMYQKTLGCALQVVDYTYNLNGWMKTMNNPTNLVTGKDFFGMKLNYDTDGNIKSQQFGYADRKGKHTDLGFSVNAGPVYNNVYSYDNLKRITSHTIGTNGNSSNVLNLTNSYDENGNILTMNRTIQGIAVDAMSYTYQAGGNRILSIAESGGGDSDAKYETFKPRGSGNYTYDAAGNIKNDSYKGTGDITYNVLNLPSTMASRSFKQFYNASGAKVRSERAEGKYDYLGPLVYKNDQLEFVSTAEGRALPPGIVKQNFNYDDPNGRDTTNRFWRYEYNLKDHLGNLRVTCRCAEKNEIDQDSRTDAYKPLVVQQAHYDAWGMKLPFFNPNKKYEGSPTDNFKYNGKEYMADLGYYEYGFRIYDPTTARFTAVDPLAMDYAYKSTYDYAENSPIRFIDLDGLEKAEPEIYKKNETKQEVYARGKMSMTFGGTVSNDMGVSGTDINLGSITLKETKFEVSNDGSNTYRSSEDYSFNKSDNAKVSANIKVETPIAGGQVRIDGVYSKSEGKFVEKKLIKEGEFASVLNFRETKDLLNKDIVQEIGIGEDFSKSFFGVSLKMSFEFGVKSTNPQPRNYSVRGRVREQELARMKANRKNE